MLIVEGVTEYIEMFAEYFAMFIEMIKEFFANFMTAAPETDAE